MAPRFAVAEARPRWTLEEAVTRGLGLGWWSVAYDMLPLARDAAEDRRNVRIASDFDAAMRSIGFCIASAGALHRSFFLGQRAFALGYASRVAPPAWTPNTRGKAAP